MHIMAIENVLTLKRGHTPRASLLTKREAWLLLTFGAGLFQLRPACRKVSLWSR